VTQPNERFASLVMRELSATAVHIAMPDEPERESDTVLSARLQDGRRVDAEFGQPIEDRAALARRLQMLVAAFESALAEPPEEGPRRKPPAISLRDELRAMTMRAGAADAIVIDAHSPVTWATAHGAAVGPFTITPELRKALELEQMSRRDLIDAIRQELDGNDADWDESPVPPETSAPPVAPVAPIALAPAPPAKSEPPPQMSALSNRAIEEVRMLPTLATLRRGGHLAYVVREDDFGILARSFAGIYVLLVVFDHLFDELRAERSVRESLPRIERLVLALPPLDPEPTDNVTAMRQRRRR
jgi:hypothetical protein